jgi:hypothetical protein
MDNRALSEDERQRSERMRELALARWENEGGAVDRRGETEKRTVMTGLNGPELHEAVVCGGARGFVQDITTGRHRAPTIS